MHACVDMLFVFTCASDSAAWILDKISSIVSNDPSLAVKVSPLLFFFLSKYSAFSLWPVDTAIRASSIHLIDVLKMVGVNGGNMWTFPLLFKNYPAIVDFNKSTWPWIMEIVCLRLIIPKSVSVMSEIRCSWCEEEVVEGIRNLTRVYFCFSSE